MKLKRPALDVYYKNDIDIMYQNINNEFVLR